MPNNEKVKVSFWFNCIVKVYTAWIVLPFIKQTVYLTARGSFISQEVKIQCEYLVGDIAKYFVPPGFGLYVLISN